MIKITDRGLEVEIPVKTESDKLMHSINKEAFEMATMMKDIRILLTCLISKYGKEKTLMMVTAPMTDLFETEDFDKALNSEEEEDE